MGEFDISPGGGVVARLFDQTLLADTASIDTGATGFLFPLGYSALLVLAQLRTTAAGSDLAVNFTVNNDTGANYDEMVWYGQGSGSTTTSTASRGLTAWALDAVGTNASDSYMSSMTIWLPNYSGTTWWKSGTYTAGVPYSQSNSLFALNYALGWRSTAAITRLKAAPASGSLKAGSRITIYGMP